MRIYRRNREWTRELLPRDGPALELPELEFVLPVEAIYARAEGGIREIGGKRASASEREVQLGAGRFGVSIAPAGADGSCRAIRRLTRCRLNFRTALRAYECGAVRRLTPPAHFRTPDVRLNDFGFVEIP